MVKRETINGRVFIAQTTYRIYRSEDELQDGKPPALTTSDRKLFNGYKRREKYQVKKKEPETIYGMYKSQFAFTKQEDGLIGLAECPHCKDTVVWNDGCVKCSGTFIFKECECKNSTFNSDLGFNICDDCNEKV